MASKGLKLAAAIVETILGIPLLGALIIVGTLWTVLILSLTLHIITLIFSIKENKNKNPSILGIITSAIGWIPIVGMIMHIITAIFYWTDWSKK